MVARRVHQSALNRGPAAAPETTAARSQTLAKILRRLVLAGILESRKGKAGGFTLARSADAISFEDVLAAVDALPIANHCAFGWGACNATRPCPLHDMWTAMTEEFRDWAATTTFADLGELHSTTRRGSRASRRRKQ